MKINSFDQISIPTPCHEDWDTMTPEEKGRFCAVCNKTVYDFSNVSSVEEFNQIVAKEEHKNICGQFNTQQIKQHKPIITRISRALRYFALALVMTFGLAKTANAQLHEKPETHYLKGDVCVSSGGIMGTVTDRVEKNSLTGISINVYANNVLITSAKTDDKGNYKIASLDPGKYTVTLMGNGYKTLTTQNVEIKYKVVTFNATLEQRKQDEKIMGKFKCN